MSEYRLLQFRDNYADEFDVEGFWACREKECDEYFNAAKEAFERPQEMYFGTNEYIEYSSLAEFESSFTISEITKSQYDFLRNTLAPNGYFGVFFTIDHFGELIDDNEF